MMEQVTLPVCLVVVALASIFIVLDAAAIIIPISLAMMIVIAMLPLPYNLMKRGLLSPLSEAEG